MRTFAVPWRTLAHLPALAGYSALTCLYTWPLARHFATHFPGVESEAGGIWSLWHFQYALRAGSNPFWADEVYWPYGFNLILNLFAPFNGYIGAVLIPHLGLNATYNLLYMSAIALSGWGVYLFAMDWGLRRGASMLAGAVFAFNPIMTQNIKAQGLDYMSWHPLPLFLWALHRACRDKRLLHAILAALMLTWVWCYNYYQFLGCVLMIPLFYVLLEKPASFIWAWRPAAGRLMPVAWILGVAQAAAFGFVVRALWEGQRVFGGRGGVKTLFLYVAPYLLFWMFAGMNLLLRLRLRLVFNRDALRWRAWSPTAAIAIVWAAMNWPLIRVVLYSMGSGDYGSPASRWRGGGDPADPLLLLLPNYFQPLWSGLSIFHILNGTAVSFGLLSLLIAFYFIKRPPDDRWHRLWLWCFAFFFVLTLGPWLKLLGVHTYLILPFYFLHLLPVFNNMPNGHYFSVHAALFLALLTGAFLHVRCERLRALGLYAWARALPALAAAAFAFEFWHSGAPLFQYAIPPLIPRIKPLPEGVLLTIPTSACFPLRGNYSLMGNMFMNPSAAQIVHEKPIYGGKMGRVAQRVFENMSTDALFTSLIDAQSGGKIARLLSDPFLIGRYLSGLHIRYLLVEQSLIPEPLRRVMECWPVKYLDSEGTMVLYEFDSVRAALIRPGPIRRCRRRWRG